MPGSILIVVAYVLAAVFLAAFLTRTVALARLPLHLRWELAPVPHEKGKGTYGGSYFEEYEWWTRPREKSLVNELAYMFQEIVFLKGVWKHNRPLWWFSFPFHFGLYALIAAAPLLALGMALDAVGLWGGGLIRTGVTAVATLGFGLGGIGAVGLLVKRLTDSRLKPFTTAASLFNLGLLVLLFASGALAVTTSEGFAPEMETVAAALLTANTGIAIPPLLAVHLLVTFFFLAYLPFTPMMHFVAKYFTYHQVRWDDAPLQPGGRMEQEVVELLRQGVTWSGPHIRGDGKRNWIDVATEDPMP